MSAPRSSAQDSGVPPLGDVLEFLRLIWRLDHRLQEASKRMQRGIGVTGTQRLVIRLVSRFPGVSLGRLAELLELHPSTLTGVIRRLSRASYLEVTRDPGDARRFQLLLTRRGRALEGIYDGTVEERVASVVGLIPKAELAVTMKHLAAISAALGQPPPPSRSTATRRLKRPRQARTSRVRLRSNGLEHEGDEKEC